MPRRALTLLTVVAVLLAIAAIELLSGTSNDSQAGSQAPPLPTEVLVPPPVDLAALRGEPAAITFWASWCGPCAREASAIERFANSPAGRGRVVGVDWSDDLSAARAFVRDHGWTFPSLRDPNGVAGNRYGLRGLPVTFVLDPQGRITQVLRGPQTEPALTAALDSARSG